MKKTFFTILTVSTLGTTLAPTFSQHQAAEAILNWDIGVMSGNDTIIYPKSGMRFVTNNEKPLVFNFLDYANTWEAFVNQYPYFKFINSSIKTSLKGDNKHNDLDNVAYSTRNFNTGKSGLMYYIAKIKSTFIGDYIELAVVGMLLDNSIKFGVMYTLNITQQYAKPYPFYNSIAGSIQFMSDR